MSPEIRSQIVASMRNRYIHRLRQVIISAADQAFAKTQGRHPTPAERDAMWALIVREMIDLLQAVEHEGQLPETEMVRRYIKKAKR